MKHQLFKNNTYVLIDVGLSHVVVVGQVCDSTITGEYLPKEPVFNTPAESIEVHPRLLLLYENPDVLPKLIDDVDFIKDISPDFSNMVIHEDGIFVSINNIEPPSKELKDLYYKLNQKRMDAYYKLHYGAKSKQR